MREREMGKNYLLETYLKDLEDPEENAAQIQDLGEDVMRLQQDRIPEIGRSKADQDNIGYTRLFHCICRFS